MNPLPGMTKRPAGEDYMRDAVEGFINWASTKQELLQQYQLYQEQEVGDMNYLDWLIVNFWGEEE